MIKISDEINNMTKALNSGSTDAPGTESAATATPGTNAPSTDAPSTEAPGTDAPNTAAPATDAPTTSAPTTEAPDEKDVTISDLRKKVSDLEGKKIPPKEEPPKIPEPVELESQDFLGDLDPYETVNNKEALNKLLNVVYQKGVNVSRDMTSEGVLRSIPDIVRFNINLMNDLKKSSDEFYDKNKDLAPFKRVVATVFEEVASKNPEKKPNDILEDVAKEVRSRLELHKKTTVSDNKSDGHPKLPEKRGSAGKPADQPKISALEAELSDMNKVVGR